jgi:hypothetical protein
MGLNVELQDELGGRTIGVDDPRDLLATLLPPVGDDAYPMLGSIDPYADTTFNNLQMRLFLVEWASVSEKARTVDEQLLVSASGSLARRCRDEVHVYLKFIGD